MPPEILALIDKPLSLIAVLFVGAGIGYVEVVGGEMNSAELRRVVERLALRAAGG